MHHTVDKASAASWMEYSNDWNPLHHDSGYAMNAGYAGTIVHGILPYIDGFHRIVLEKEQELAPTFSILGKFHKPLLHDVDPVWTMESDTHYKLSRDVADRSCFLSMRLLAKDPFPQFDKQAEECLQVIPLEETLQQMRLCASAMRSRWTDRACFVATCFVSIVRQALPLNCQLPPYLQDLGLGQSGREDLLHILQKVTMARDMDFSSGKDSYLIITRLKGETSYLGTIQSFRARVFQRYTIKTALQSDFLKLESKNEFRDTVRVS